MILNFISCCLPSLNPLLSQTLVCGYGGQRSGTAMHYQVAEDHGFTAIADFVVMHGFSRLSHAFRKWVLFAAPRTGTACPGCVDQAFPFLGAKANASLLGIASPLCMYGTIPLASLCSTSIITVHQPIGSGSKTNLFPVLQN